VIKRGKDVCYFAGELFQARELIATATATALVRGSKV
jgi:acyl-coenzyme A thioesterase PaaI-like protein